MIGLNSGMSAYGPSTNLRAIALMLGLFAVTLAVFQPLANAAALRIGGPEAASRMWSVFCKADPSAKGGDSQSIPTDRQHSCCFGLAHAQALALPSTDFLHISHLRSVPFFVDADDRPSTGGIRDGPHRARAPPLLLV